MYVYVPDADETYRRAIAAGADSVEPPLDTPYGDRRAMVRVRSATSFRLHIRSIAVTGADRASPAYAPFGAGSSSRST